MKLIIAIEISPYNYTDKTYEYPKKRKKDAPNEWGEFWLKCISDSQLQNLIPIEIGSYLVDVEGIGEEELRTIIKKEIEDVDLTDFEEQLIAFYGGIVVTKDDKILIEPMCCGDLRNTSEWGTIIEEEHIDWQHLWIGHPWIFYRKINGIVEFSDYTDSNLEDFKDIKSVLNISENELKLELKKIKTQQEKLKDRIQIILEKMKITNSSEIAKMLSGVEVNP